MAEDQGKEKEKFEFTSGSDDFGYTSLDQARVQTIEASRDNREYYGA